jgi:hypothetical protein
MLQSPLLSHSATRFHSASVAACAVPASATGDATITAAVPMGASTREVLAMMVSPDRACGW